MRRWGGGAAMGTLAGMLACTEPAVFACGGDSDCVLGGDQGQCQANGSCAYPDDDCTSGLSYPEGAPPDLAGRCVPDDGSTSTGSGGTDTGAMESGSSEGDSSTGASTSGADEGSSSESGSSGAAESGSSTGGTDSSGGATCNADEIGDTPEDALVLGMCAGKYDGLVQDATDEDWFFLGECSGGLASLDISVEVPDSVVVCLVPSCEQGDAPALDCGEGVEVPDMTGQVQGCCGVSAFEVGYDCQGEPVALYVLAASTVLEAPECTGYAFTVLAQ